MRRPLLSACASALLVTAVVAAAVHLGFTVSPSSVTTASAVSLAVRPWAIIAVAYALLVAFTLRTVSRNEPDRRVLSTWFRPSFGDFTSGTLGAVVLFALIYAGQKLLTPEGSAREAWLVRLYLMLGDPTILRAHVPAVIAAVVAVAAMEELVWRGYVQRILSAELGNVRGLILAAILYALAHVPSMFALADGSVGANPLLPLAALAGGLLWGTMVRMSKGRLIPAIVAHALFDWCVVVQFRLWGPSV